ncbi:MAG: mobile mystery protein A [Alphaproteobacteria bacterium]|jgi:predicted DNA-binding mobile mystery protein A|nr:mobile mystery protein A [Alphaproteobacteria bacterium]MBT7943039.1 mobile mystery protein A [Alphaproteobacteria bacterium]
MNTQAKLLAIKQLDQVLSGFKLLRAVSRPAHGWVHAIRKTIGMSAKQLGNRANMSQAGIAQIEKSEAEGKATLSTMHKMAAALDCTFVYALVPKTTLHNSIERQATNMAVKRVRRASHSMSLESQTVTDEQTDLQIKMLTDEILATLPRHMWNQDGS